MSESDVSINFGKRIKSAGATTIISTLVSGLVLLFGPTITKSKNGEESGQRYESTRTYSNQTSISKLETRTTVIETKQEDIKNRFEKIYNKLEKIQETQIKILQGMR